MIRVGYSRRLRGGHRAWVSMPLWALALAVLIALPLIIDWYFLRVCWVAAAWLVREFTLWRSRARQ